MLHKSRGIVFSSTHYGETSLIVRIYTELFGVQSYIVNSVRKKHARIHQNIFQVMTPVDLVFYYKERPGIQRIADIRSNPPLTGIPFDVHKSSMIFFLGEILNKCIHEEESNPALFGFLQNAILWLDNHQDAGNDFHLVFLLQLSRYLGFGPTDNFSEEKKIFDLREGQFQSNYPDHPHFISGEISRQFASLIHAGFPFSLDIDSHQRRKLIDVILEFFELHIEGFGNVKSHKVLEDVWN